MTREILFRGKRLADGRWVYGSLVCGRGMKPTSIEYCRAAIRLAVIETSIGQYTGLKDRNGRRIFEGDILMDHTDPEHPEAETHAVIEWRGFGWVLVEKGEFFDTVVEADDRTWTVIGNIWDNPEMVEVSAHEM